MDLHEALNGQHYGLGLTDPEPGDLNLGAARGFAVQTLDAIKKTLADRNSGALGYFSRRATFDLSWNSNQGRTSACNGHATARTLSRAFFMKTGEKVLLSGADAYAQMNGGRDQGSSLARGIQVVTTGIATEATVPEADIYSRSPAALAERARFRGHEPIAVDTQEEFATGLLLGFFGVVAVQVDRGGRYESLDGRGVSRGGNGPGNHAVGVDDLRLAPDGTIEFDQYGSWGDHCPRVWLRWDQHLRQTVQNHRFWLIAAAVEDPQDADNPPAVKP